MSETPYDKMDQDISRNERLVARYLDGEISAAEREELQAELARDASLRQMLDEYRSNDLLAIEALRMDLSAREPQAMQPRHRRLWIFAGAAILSAAAMILVSILPDLVGAPEKVVIDPDPDGIRKRVNPPVGRSFVDYSQPTYHPSNRVGNVHHDLIGIRGDNPNVIYIFERKRRSTDIVPVSGEF